jgi:hypothetical protein
MSLSRMMPLVKETHLLWREILRKKKQEQYSSQALLSRFDESQIILIVITFSCDYLRKIFDQILEGANGIIRGTG